MLVRILLFFQDLLGTLFLLASFQDLPQRHVSCLGHSTGPACSCLDFAEQRITVWRSVTRLLRSEVVRNTAEYTVVTEA